MTTLVDAPTRVDGVELIGEMVGSGYRTPPALVRRGDGQVLQLTPLLYTGAGRRGRAAHVCRDRRARRPGAGAQRDRGRRPDARRQPPAPARAAQARRRHGAGVQALEPVVGAQGPGHRHRPGRHPTDHRPVPPAVPAGPGHAHPGRVPGRGGVGVLRPRARRLGLRRVPASAPAAARVRGHDPLRWLPRVRPRRRGPLQRRPARCHGRGPLPRVAGVLHRRHRQLPTGPGGPDPHRPRRPLLQRDRRGGDVRLVVGHRVGGPAAAGRHPGDADGQTAAAAAALRRIPPARRPGRCPGPLPPDQAHPARVAAAPLEGAREQGTQALGAGLDHAVGARRPCR